MRFRSLLFVALAFAFQITNAQGLVKNDKLIKFGLALGAADFNQDFISGFSFTGELITNDSFGNGSLGLGVVAGTLARRFNRIEGGVVNIGTVRNQFLALHGAWYPNYFRGKNIQLYLAVNMGVRYDYRVGTFAGTEEDFDTFKIGHGYAVGLHFLVSKQIGAYLDLGFGLSNIGVGAYYKIGRNYNAKSSTVSR